MASKTKCTILESTQIVTSILDSFGWNTIGKYIYNPNEKIQEGSHGIVYKGKNLYSKNLVAVKVIPKSKVFTIAHKKSLEREVTLLRQLVADPYIISLYDVYQDSVFYYLVFDRMKEDLYEYFTRRQILSEKEAKPLITKIALGLKTLHDKGIVHRDIKQENILLSKGLDVVRICDFGFAIKPKEGQVISARCGSLNTVAPEIVAGRGYRFEVDIWAFGCILFSLLGGYYPYEYYPYDERRKKPYPHGLSANCLDLLEGLLAFDPKNRLKIDQVLAHSWMN